MQLQALLQSPVALLFLVPLFVAAIRQLTKRADGTQRIDGPWLVAACATVCGALFAVLQAELPRIIAFITAHPIVGAVLAGATAGFFAFGGHDLLAGLMSKAASLNIDARTVPGPVAKEAPKKLDYEVTLDASQAEASILALKTQLDDLASVAHTVPPSRDEIPPPPPLPTVGAP